ncbi:MAG: hypothetical protein LBR40_06410, partial [Bacilli bacterium]|nr:hypothetical protein [Bacilli bacterium]
RGEIFRKANERAKMFVANYINELNLTRTLITNSVLQGEIGLDNTNPWINSYTREKENRHELITKNWLNGIKRDQNIKLNKIKEITFKQNYQFPDLKWERFEIGDIDYNDPNKKRETLYNLLKNKYEKDNIDLKKVFDDIYQSRRERPGANIVNIDNDYHAQEPNFIAMDEDQKLHHLADLIIHRKIPSITEYLIDLRPFTYRNLDQPLKPKRISHEEFLKLPMNAKVAYENIYPDYYKDVDTMHSEWSLNDEMMGLDIILMHQEDRAHNDHRPLYDKEYYRKLPMSVKRWIKQYYHPPAPPPAPNPAPPNYDPNPDIYNDPNVDDTFLNSTNAKNNQIEATRYDPWINEQADLLLDDATFDGNHPGYLLFKNSLPNTIPEKVVRRKFLNENGNITIPAPESINKYIKNIKELAKKLPNQPGPEYETFISKEGKRNAFQLLPDHRSVWLFHGQKTIHDHIQQTPEDMAYAMAIKKMINHLLKHYPESSGIFNNIRNLSCLTLDDLLRIEKMLKSTKNIDPNMLYSYGEKLNGKLIDRIKDNYGYAVAVLKDLKANFSNHLNERTKRWIDELSYDMQSLVVTANLPFILRNANDKNIINLANILGSDGAIDTTDISSAKPYKHKFDVLSILQKPVGTQLEIQYDPKNDEETYVDVLSKLYEKELHMPTEKEPEPGWVGARRVKRAMTYVWDKTSGTFKWVATAPFRLTWELGKLVYKKIKPDNPGPPPPPPPPDPLAYNPEANPPNMPHGLRKKAKTNLDHQPHANPPDLSNVDVVQDDEKEQRFYTDKITIIKNDEKEIQFVSDETGEKYTILKDYKPKLKRLIKINNQLIPKGTENEYKDGIYTDLTTNKYQYNEIEITETKQNPPKIKE